VHVVVEPPVAVHVKAARSLVVVGAGSVVICTVGAPTTVHVRLAVADRRPLTARIVTVCLPVLSLEYVFGLRH
jgi:hypothetical protein